MYIVIEGCDNSGKTTLQRDLVTHYLRQSYVVRQLREPDQAAIREIVKTGQMPWSSSYLFMADHLHNQLEVVVPHLAKQDAMVIQDRHARISQAAYCLAQTNRLDPLIVNNPDFMALPKVDLLIYVDVPVEELLRRKTAQKQVRETAVENDVYDDYSTKKLTYLANAYRSIMRSNYIKTVAENVVTFAWEGENSDEVRDMVISIIDSFLPQEEEAE